MSVLILDYDVWPILVITFKLIKACKAPHSILGCNRYDAGTVNGDISCLVILSFEDFSFYKFVFVVVGQYEVSWVGLINPIFEKVFGIRSYVKPRCLEDFSMLTVDKEDVVGIIFGLWWSIEDPVLVDSPLSDHLCL